ncbi:MAG: hypothetical protein DBX39_03315 [Bacillota bacterium]|nr:MAG: hypothetical protein DBX39_03315 [Bacillota bacterium]
MFFQKLMHKFSFAKIKENFVIGWINRYVPQKLQTISFFVFRFEFAYPIKIREHFQRLPIGSAFFMRVHFRNRILL